MPQYTPHQSRYFAEQILLKRPQSSVDNLASAMSGVKVDLNPHQADAALFAMKSPLSNGALLADEVGLGKTIEAGLVLAQYWAERKRHIETKCKTELEILMNEVAFMNMNKENLQKYLAAQCAKQRICWKVLIKP